MSRSLVFTPVGGGFDVAAMRGWLDARPDVFEDPRQRDVFYVCGLPSLAVFACEQMMAGKPVMRGACAVYLSADRVLLDQEDGDATDLRSTMDFVAWLVRCFECRIRIDGQDDLTERVRERGVACLYDEDVREMPLPWEGTLIRIGFFRELYHGDAMGPSLERARRSEASAEADVAVRYLEAGQLYRRAATLRDTHPWLHPPAGEYTWDVLADARIALPPPHLLTDGVFVWPADLAYYVRVYHVRLPRAFVMHARRNHWRVPAFEVASLPVLEI